MKKIVGIEPDLYTLTDEDGVAKKYALLDVLEFNGETYYALLTYEINKKDITPESDVLVVLKKAVVNGEEVLATVDDNDEFCKIGQMFLERITK